VLRAELFPQPVLERDGAPISRPTGGPRPLVDYGYVGQLDAFWADVEHGRSPFMDAAFGRSVLDVVCAAYTSAHNTGALEPVPFGGRRDRTPLELWRGG
jgi:hypothetical protein